MFRDSSALVTGHVAHRINVRQRHTTKGRSSEPRPSAAVLARRHRPIGLVEAPHVVAEAGALREALAAVPAHVRPVPRVHNHVPRQLQCVSALPHRHVRRITLLGVTKGVWQAGHTCAVALGGRPRRTTGDDTHAFVSPNESAARA